MTTKPETSDEGSESKGTPWKLPPYIWHPTFRRAWLEAAERAWTEGYVENFERGRLQRLVLRLLYWRDMEAPPAVRRKILATTDLDRLMILRERAYEVADPADLFASE